MKRVELMDIITPEGVSLVSTSWYINKHKDFTGDWVLLSENDTEHLRAINIPYDFKDRDVIYGKVSYRLSNGYVSPMSQVFPIYRDDVDMTSMSVSSPTFTHQWRYDHDGTLLGVFVKLEPPIFYSVTDDIVAVQMTVRGSDGIALKEKIYHDIDKFLYLDVTSINRNKDIRLEVKYLLTDNRESLPNAVPIEYNYDANDITLQERTYAAGEENELNVVQMQYNASEYTISVYFRQNLTTRLTSEDGVFTLQAAAFPQPGIYTVIASITTTQGYFEKQFTISAT